MGGSTLGDALGWLVIETRGPRTAALYGAARPWIDHGFYYIIIVIHRPERELRLCAATMPVKSENRIIDETT